MVMPIKKYHESAFSGLERCSQNAFGGAHIAIVSNRNGIVIFKYTESKTGITKYRKLKGEDFLRLIMQHVLPKGFRRVRDYGFLHSNAKKILSLIQLVLYVIIKIKKQRPRPVFKCPECKSPMIVYGFRYMGEASG